MAQLCPRVDGSGRAAADPPHHVFQPHVDSAAPPPGESLVVGLAQGACLGEEAEINGVMLSLNTPSPGGGQVINMHHSVMDVSYQRSQQKHRKGNQVRLV